MNNRIFGLIKILIWIALGCTIIFFSNIFGHEMSKAQSDNAGVLFVAATIFLWWV